MGCSCFKKKKQAGNKQTGLRYTNSHARYTTAAFPQHFVPVRPHVKNCIQFLVSCFKTRGLPWCPGVKNPPSNAGDKGSTRSQGTKIAHVLGQLLSPHTKDSTCHKEDPGCHN